MSQPKWISQNEARVIFNQAVFHILKTNPTMDKAFRAKMQNVTTIAEFDFVVRQFLYDVHQKINQLNQQNILLQNNMDNTVSFESVMMQNPDALTSQQAEIADTIANSYGVANDDDDDDDDSNQNMLSLAVDAYANDDAAKKAEIFTQMTGLETLEELTKEKNMALKPTPPILNEKE